MEITNNDSIAQSALSRREMLGGMAALAAFAGAPCSYDGFGAPYQTQAPLDSRTARALVTLWLLFVTNPKYLNIDQNTGLIPKQTGLDFDKVAQDLKYLDPSSTGAPNQFIQSLILALNDPNNSLNVNVTQVNGMYQLNPGSALLAVQTFFDLFFQGKIKTGSAGAHPNTFYPPSQPCPGVKVVLSIANNNPTTPDLPPK